MQFAVGQNFGAQPPAAFEETLGTRSDRAVHPKTGSALLGPAKSDALNFKLLTDQSIQIGFSGEDIPPDG